MRFTEIDGKKYEIEKCTACPFGDIDVGWGDCTYPGVGNIEVTPDGIIPDECPLREGPVRNPCPFCGSTSLSEIYVDDTGEELEQWMMDEANKESESEGLAGFVSWEEFVSINARYFHVRCDGCFAMVGSMKDMADTWAKWNRKVDPKEESQ